MEKSNSHAATSPVSTAVPIVPMKASRTAGRSTGPISAHPDASPPSNRISASAITPIVRASS